MISCLIRTAVLTKPFICCLSSLPAGLVKGILFYNHNYFMSDATSSLSCLGAAVLALTTPVHCVCGVGACAYLSTIRSSVRLRRQSVRPFSPSSTSSWQEGHGNNMGGRAASFRLRPGYVPHTGTRTQVCTGEEKQGRDTWIKIQRRKTWVFADWNMFMGSWKHSVRL